MRTPIVVAVPDGRSAEELVARLESLVPSVVENDRGWSVELETAGDATLAELLSIVQSWLSDSGPESVRVVVGDSEYVMERAPAEPVSVREPARTSGSRPRSSPA